MGLPQADRRALSEQPDQHPGGSDVACGCHGPTLICWGTASPGDPVQVWPAGHALGEWAVVRIHKSDVMIRSVCDWLEHAPPKRGLTHWVDGRSAKELAKAWFPVEGDPQVPPELKSLLDSREDTRGIVFDEGEPERAVVFDGCGGEPRNADLVLWGRMPGGKVLVSIEAKADEPFGDIAGEYVRQSIARNPRTRIPERFSLLCQRVLGVDADNGEALTLRYQLLTAVAGTLADAASRGAETAVFVVHEFIGMTDDGKVDANAADLNRLVKLLSRGSIDAISPGTMAGPFEVSGNEHFAGTERLFIGKCRRILDAAACQSPDRRT